MQIEMFTLPKIHREIKEYKNTDWIKVSPSFKLPINFCNHYWYNTVHKIMLAIPMEDMFQIMIGQKGYAVSDKFAVDILNGKIQRGDNPFTIIKKFRRNE